ncbi:MAG: peptidoglycan editing factor PgeF [Anaerolineae bacterium]
MIHQEQNGVPYYTFEALADHEEIVHAIFTRLGGVSRPPFVDLNVGRLVGDDLAAVETNHRLIYETLGLSSRRVVTARQVHGDRVAVVSADDGGRVVPATDALITNTGGVNLMLRYADCLPIFLYDPETRAVGLGHAGWRGTAAGVARRMVSTMVKDFGSNPSRIIAGLGPAIGPCCYQVGPEVVQTVKPTLEDWERALHHLGGDDFSLDLREANRQQLMQTGVRGVEISDMCTACHTDEFFSHRAERGATGRFAAVMGIRESR